MNAVQTFHGRLYPNGEVVQVVVVGTKIDSIRRIEQSSGSSDSTLWLTPLLVDLQINGRSGIDFLLPDIDCERVARGVLAQDPDGVGAFLPTVTTQSFERLAHAVSKIAEAAENDSNVQERVWGIHVEGPYISPQDGPRGAHPLQHVRKPCWDEFRRLQDAARGMIKLLTLSPEYPEAPAFIENVVQSGVVISIGHTAATPDQIRAAVDAGASLSTHLGNGSHGVIKRHPNYIWEQLAEDRLDCCLIADGHHLPESVVKVFVRVKGVERTILVSDLTGMGGLPPGEYRGTPLGDVEILENGKMVVAGQREYLAGAALPLWRGLENVMNFAGVSFSDAITMSVDNPARVCRKEVPRLSVGATANFAAFEVSRAASVTAVDAKYSETDLSRVQNRVKLLSVVRNGKVIA